MRVFSVWGFSQSGKTTTIENIIRELRKRRYRVGSVKNIHCHDFAMDTEGTNTHRHREAGSQLVTAWGGKETDILFKERISLDRILNFYDHDFVVLEGVRDTNVPKIVTGHTIDDIDDKLDETVFAISGRVSKEIESYKGIPVINSINRVEELVDLIEDKVYPRLPEFPPDCCDACGYSCRELGARILRGESRRQDCIIGHGEEYIQLFIGDKQIPMVPFVKTILHNGIMGLVSELEGYDKFKDITIKVGKK